MKEMNKTIVNKTWNATEGRFDHSFKFAFQTKAEYLEFRRDWKENYATLSRTIRELKTLIKVTMRQREYAGKAQMELHALATEATVQLLMRAAAKVEANRQYLAAKAALK